MMVKTIGRIAAFLTVLFVFAGCLSFRQEKVLVPEFVKVESGHFMMGTPNDELGRSSFEDPQHKVNISSFYIGKYEITQREFASVMGFNPGAYYAPDLPVDYVSFYDAVNYCNALSKLENLTPAYTVEGTNVTWHREANGYRLPTEAEWEYTCRAGTETMYYIKDLQPKDDKFNDDAFFNRFILYGNYNTTNGFFNQGNRIIVGGSYPPNPWGIYDMPGNVFEWCWDWWGKYTADEQTDPIGPGSGINRVVRGGCYFISAKGLRSGQRDYSAVDIRWRGNGLRVARNVE